MIRPVVPDDIPFIVRSLQALREECAVGKQSANDPKYVTKNLEAMFDGGNFFGYVYGNQQGLMIGAVSSMWFCAKLRAYELSFYIRPEDRGTFAAPKLIRRFVAEATQRGAIEVHVGTYTELKAEKLIKLYERLGFERNGTGAIYRIKQ